MCKKIDFSDTSLLIIAGGKSSRMKQDKRFIEINGISLLENILIKASKQNFDAVFLCVEKHTDFIELLTKKYKSVILIDEIQNAGPMSGLAKGLSNIHTQWALAVSCDMPFFEFGVVKPLLDNLTDSKVVMFDHQPLAALYHKSLTEIFKKSLSEGQRKLRMVIEQVPHKIIPHSSFIIHNYFNINTQSDLRLARGRAANINRKVPIISIIAPSSGTGKTTFIEKLIPKLNEQGIKVGVVKSDSHGFNLDVEGKDSWRFQNAGAQSVAVVSTSGYFIMQKTSERENFQKVADKFEDIDLILTESRTHGVQPAISLYRGLGDPLINDDVVALFSDKKIENVENIPQFDLNDIDQAVKICLFLAKEVHSHL